MKKLLSFIFVATLCMSVAVPASAQALKVNAERIGNRIDVTIGNNFFTSYRFNDDEKYPFFYPVNGPVSGGSVTSMRNGEYPHHSSLFFGLDRVNGGNYWQDSLERGRIVSILGARVVETGGDKAVIEDECIWKRPDAESPIKDKRRITISAPTRDYYQLDFEVEMTMLMDVEILKTGHALFSARLATDLTVKQGGVMVNSLGGIGEKETFSKPAAWIDYYGERKSGVEGICIMQHPSSKWFPSTWFTRDYGFMSPTPFYWPEDGKGTYFSKGETLTLKYRVIVHKGTMEEAGISRLYEDYTKE